MLFSLHRPHLYNLKNFENDNLRSDEEIKRIEERIVTLAETENNYSKELRKLSQEMEEFKKSGSSKEIYIKNQVLYLSIDSSVMREELLNGKQIIIERINQFAEKEMIKNVWFN